MSEMVGRVAKAMRQHGSHQAAGSSPDYESMARAALAALREPTDAMLEAGADRWSTYYPAPDQGYVNERATWRAMIDAALKEG